MDKCVNKCVYYFTVANHYHISDFLTHYMSIDDQRSRVCSLSHPYVQVIAHPTCLPAWTACWASWSGSCGADGVPTLAGFCGPFSLLTMAWRQTLPQGSASYGPIGAPTAWSGQTWLWFPARCRPGQSWAQSWAQSSQPCPAVTTTALRSAAVWSRAMCFACFRQTQ